MVRRMAFHDATFRLLGREPAVSLAAARCLADAEQRLGVTLPASVRDWYARESAIEILADHSNDDPPVEVRQFEAIRWRSRTLLPIRKENQGVCAWAVEMDGADDPRTLVDVDSEGSRWFECAASFSAYVYSCVWDHRIVLRQPALVQAQNRKLSEFARTELSKRLQSDIATHGWPGRTQYRFRDARFGVLIWDSEQQADWFVGANDHSSLRAGLEMVWTLDGVGNSFYDCSDIGREVLAELTARDASSGS